MADAHADDLWRGLPTTAMEFEERFAPRNARSSPTKGHQWGAEDKAMLSPRFR